MTHVLTALALFIFFVREACIFAFFGTAVAGIGFQIRMLRGRIESVPGKSVVILFGATAILAVILGIVYLLLPYELALIAVSVAGAAVIAWKTPIDIP
jgi:hypothetical protein